MNETIQFRDSVMVALDGLMFNFGFRRNKRSQSWKRKISSTQSIGTHLNFGMREAAGAMSIIPSVWLRDERLVKLEVECGILDTKNASKNAQFGRTTKSQGGRNFDCLVTENPKEIAESIFTNFESFGIPYLNRLTDNEFIINQLKSDKVDEWPVDSRSIRARLLPLVLVVQGRTDEACSAIDGLEKDIAGKDQLIPDYRDFLKWFRSNYCS